ncbi:MAG: hypothetical protein PHW43_08480 [Syntrophales bacterium]|nr:hypothetical protein [Syntrophales bacterium]
MSRAAKKAGAIADPKSNLRACRRGKTSIEKPGSCRLRDFLRPPVHHFLMKQSSKI